MIVLVVSILKEPSEYQYYGMVLGVAAEIFLLIYFFPFFLYHTTVKRLAEFFLFFWLCQVTSLSNYRCLISGVGWMCCQKQGSLDKF